MINTAAIKNLGINKVHKVMGATVTDIVRQTRENEALATKALAAVAQDFRGASKEDTYRNIWNFLKNQVPYKADTGKAQIIKLPAALVADGGDCKSFALFTIGVLNNLGLKAKYRLTTYDPARPNNAHIYVITADGYIIDAVYNQFNAEKQYFTKKDYNTTMTQLSTIGSYTVGAAFSADDFMAEYTKQIASGQISDAYTKATRTILAIPPATLLARGLRFWIIWAFQNNVGNIATNFSKVKKPQKDIIRKAYYALRGSIATLDAAAAIGKNQPAISNAKAALEELRNDLKKVSDRKLTKGTSQAAQIWRGSKVGEPLELAIALGSALATVLALVKYLNEETAILDKAGAGKENTPLDNQIITLKKQGYPDSEAAKVAKTTTEYVAKVWAAYNNTNTDTPGNNTPTSGSSSGIAKLLSLSLLALLS